VFYEETFLPFYTYRWSPLRGFLQGNFKFLRGSRDQSFQIADDQEEEISRVKPDVHQRLAKKFGPRLKETGRPSDQTAVPIGLKEDLMSLGYLSSPVREIPKDFMTTVSTTRKNASLQMTCRPWSRRQNPWSRTATGPSCCRDGPPQGWRRWSRRSTFRAQHRSEPRRRSRLFRIGRRSMNPTSLLIAVIGVAGMRPA